MSEIPLRDHESFAVSKNGMGGSKVVLVTGASGYVGQHLVDNLAKERPELKLVGLFGGLDTFAAEFDSKCICRQVDLADRAAVTTLLKEVKPDVIVHLAAISSPAKCASDPDGSRKVNECMALIDGLPAGADFVFLSTDQVYEGTSPPYTETSKASPVNVYGESKLAFEKALRAKLPSRSVCLRSSLILGPPTPGQCRKQSFLQFCDEKLAAGEPTDFFADEWRSVVAVEDVVAVLRFMIDGGVAESPGVFNMGGPNRLSRADVAFAVCERRQHSRDALRAVARSSVVVDGPRSPPDISMDSSRLTAATGVAFCPLETMLDSAFPKKADETETGLPKWLDELLKPGVSQGVFSTLKACLVGLVLTLCVMLALLEDPTLRMHISIFLGMSVILLLLVIWFVGELQKAMAEEKAQEALSKKAE